MDIRIGQGIDVHRFSDDPSRPLILGGVHFPEIAGLVGHSDADPVIHACIDALLGAADLGDIGMLFPDTDPIYAGADSAELLRETLRQLRQHAWRVVNIDCTVILEKPKLAPRRKEMQDRLTRLVGAPVTVKATRTEGLGALGRSEGIGCIAVALIQRTKEQER